MTDKLFDIIPPKYNKHISRTSSPQKKRNFKLGYLILIIILLFGIGAYFFVKPNLEINLWPDLIDDHYNISVHISTSTSAVDFKNLSIPGSILTTEKEISKEFKSSQETVSDKAHGIIRVYNNYSSQPITLIKNTRFMSSSGKIFLATSRFTIPGKPLYKDVEVVAAEAGSDYNIKASSFSIPGLRGTPLYTSVYGKSSQPMSGGYIGSIYKVTQDNLDEAKKSLMTLGSQKAKEDLLSNKPDNVVILGSTLTYSLEDFFPLAEAGQNVSSFTAKAKIKANALSFNKNDLNSLVKSYVLSKIPEGQVIDNNYLNFSFNPDSVIVDNTINVDIRSRRYLKLDTQLLKERIAGCRKIDIASSVLDFYPHLIAPPRIDLFPFWAQRAPIDCSRIKINIHLKS